MADNRPYHEHFSEPVIIDNPPAELNLLPADHAQYLDILLPKNGRHWRISARDTITGIIITEDDSDLWIEAVNMVDPVTIAFDVTNLSATSTPAGTMNIVRIGNDLEFHCFPEDGPGAGFLRWSKVNGLLRTPNRVGLVSEPGPDHFEYKITSVTYTTTTGRVTRRRNSQSTPITVTLLAPKRKRIN